MPADERLGRRARRLALSLVELGEDREAVERQLLRWKFQPAVARASADWASERHHHSWAYDGDDPPPAA